MDNLGPQPERARIKRNTFVPDSVQSITGLYVCVCMLVLGGCFWRAPRSHFWVWKISGYNEKTKGTGGDGPVWTDPGVVKFGRLVQGSRGWELGVHDVCL